MIYDYGEITVSQAMEFQKWQTQRFAGKILVHVHILQVNC
jgi:predicted transcriptional regulator